MRKQTESKQRARKKIGACLRMARAYSGMSQQQAADKIGVHYNTVYRLESGLAVDVCICSHLLPMCEVYKVNPLVIMEEVVKAYKNGLH